MLRKFVNTLFIIKNSNVKKTIKPLLTICILGLVLSKIEIVEIVRTLQQIRLSYLFLALTLIPVWILFKVLKWHSLVRAAYKGASINTSIKSFLCGHSLGIITPGKIGELSRALFIPTSNKLLIASLVLVDRVCDLVVLLILAGGGVLVLYSKVLGICFYLLGIIGIVFIFFFRKIVDLVRKRRDTSFSKKIFQLLDSLKILDKKVLSLVLFLSFAIFLVSIITCYLLILSFNSISLAVVFAVIPIVLFTNVFPLTIGNLGIREGAMILLLNPYGISEGVAFNVGLLLFFVHTIIPGLLGAVLFLKE